MARDSHVYTKNFPRVPVKLYEGTLTRYTTGFNEVGGQQDVAVYQYPVVKGDLVKIKDHTTEGLILVEKVAAGDDVVLGIVVDTPEGVDNATASGGTPVAALRRKATVAVFGLGVIELVASATGAVTPGAVVGFDDDEIMEVEEESAAPVANGMMVALSYAAAGSKVAILIGACGYAPEV